MANWWDNLAQGASTAGSSAADALGSFGYNAGLQALKLAGGVARTNPLTQIPANLIDNGYLGFQALSGGKVPEGSLASRLQGLAGMAPPAGGMRGSGSPAGEAPSALSGMPAGPTLEEQKQAYIMGVFGQAYPGGGGPSLGGFDTLLADFDSRETALGGRKAENESFISGIIEAARTRGTDAQGRIQGRYDEMGAAASDQRAAEINAIQNSELTRLAQRNAARAALGVDGGADIASAENESAGAGISAAGSIAARDAQIQQSIETQQSSNQLAGLDPMQLMANRQLSNSYEDRLAEIASGRAGVMAQRAQAQASYRSPSPSISELLAVQDSANQMFGPGPAPDISGTSLEVVQQFGTMNPQNAPLYSQILEDLPGIMSEYNLGFGGKNMDPIELTNAIIAVRPDYGEAYPFITELVASFQQ